MVEKATDSEHKLLKIPPFINLSSVPLEILNYYRQTPYRVAMGVETSHASVKFRDIYPTDEDITGEQSIGIVVRFVSGINFCFDMRFDNRGDLLLAFTGNEGLSINTPPHSFRIYRDIALRVKNDSTDTRTAFSYVMEELTEWIERSYPLESILLHVLNRLNAATAGYIHRSSSGDRTKDRLPKSAKIEYTDMHSDTLRVGFTSQSALNGGLPWPGMLVFNKDTGEILQTKDVASWKIIPFTKEDLCNPCFNSKQ